MRATVYVASRKEPGSICQYSLLDSGVLTFQKAYSIPCPAYLAIEGDSLYALLREPFLMQSGVVQYRINSDHSLSQTSDIIPVHGAIAAHLLAFNSQIYVANYLSSSIVRLSDKCALYRGHGPVPIRQECPHPHCIAISPSDNLLCVADLGADRIWLHDLDLNNKGCIALPPGCGPRHLAFSKDGRYLYCVTELASTVEVLKRTENSFERIASYPTIPPNYQGKNAGSAIRLSADGKYLYASNRGHNSICTFAIDGETLEKVSTVSCAGQSPRDFILFDKFLLCGNELSNELVIFSVENDGTPKNTGHRVSVQMPWSILATPSA